ncbi:hypothetical protein SS05631_c03720 [Sinorhizobium sp. CCBAU 05631]|nr:hypothetical protein SS05631_c03720 [Sinorhizobium sp. CCBAU 05631]
MFREVSRPVSRPPLGLFVRAAVLRRHVEQQGHCHHVHRDAPHFVGISSFMQLKLFYIQPISSYVFQT